METRNLQPRPSRGPGRLLRGRDGRRGWEPSQQRGSRGRAPRAGRRSARGVAGSCSSQLAGLQDAPGVQTTTPRSARASQSAHAPQEGTAPVLISGGSANPRVRSGERVPGRRRRPRARGPRENNETRSPGAGRSVRSARPGRAPRGAGALGPRGRREEPAPTWSAEDGPARWPEDPHLSSARLRRDGGAPGSRRAGRWVVCHPGPWVCDRGARARASGGGSSCPGVGTDPAPGHEPEGKAVVQSPLPRPGSEPGQRPRPGRTGGLGAPRSPSPLTCPVIPALHL